MRERSRRIRTLSRILCPILTYYVNQGRHRPSEHLWLVALAAGLGEIVPRWLFLPYAVQFAECVFGTSQPAIGWKPKQIGLRQLFVSTLFTLLFVAACLIG